jgi:PAS domain S-box-containing protein
MLPAGAVGLALLGVVTLVVSPSRVAAAGAALALAAAAALSYVRWLHVRLRRQTAALQEASNREACQAHILSHVADAIVATSADGRITIWNGGAEALFGARRSEAVGRPLTEVIAHRRIAHRDGDLRATLARQGEWKGDAEIVGPNGDTIFVEVTARGLPDGTGTPRGHLLVIHSVDARRRAELEARTRARQQAAIASLGQHALAGMDFGLLLQQAAGVVHSALHVYATGVLEVTGEGDALKVAAAQGWPAADRAATAPVDRTRYPDCALASASAVVATELAHPLLDGESIVASAAVVIPGASHPYGLLLVADRRRRTFSRDDLHFLHSIAGVIGSSFDRLRVERELHASVALQRATLEATAEGIVSTDASGRVTGFNQRFIDMWQFPAEVTSAEHFDEWVGWVKGQFADPEAGMSGYRSATASDGAHEAVIACRDGRVMERHTQPQLLDGRMVGRVWCYRDITARVRAEEERLRLDSQMQQTQKLESLGLLAGGIAHDFNNLLVSMLGNAGLALTEVPASSTVYERLLQVQTAAQRAAELTNQMLTYSGRGRLTVQSADISALVEEMVSLLRAAVAKNVQIHVDAGRELPPFEGDTGQIRQVIMNLITNASDAIGANGGRIDVVTGRQQVTRAYLADACVGADLPEGEFVFAEVRDTGCGMDGATLARIFDPFFTTKTTGRGLGLAAALGIVRGHRGAIKIVSQQGRGTTFRVLLPTCHTPVGTAAQPPAASCTPVNARVLVVDDEASVRAIARESLKRAGFSVVAVDGGASAIEAVGQSSFDAVLLDLTMPGIGGVDVFRAIKRMQPALPVVVTSGYSQQQIASSFGADAADGFIQKPFLPAALVAALQLAISRTPAEVA